MATRPRRKPAISASTADALSTARRRFIAVWGQMGAKWGIPRTMAEVHALLFIEGRPMNTDEVMQRLRISRGNASMTLRALVDWSIVHRAHLPGDRKEYFVAEQDVWRLFRTIARERKKREIDPLLDALRECRAIAAESAAIPGVAHAAAEAHNDRLDRMLDFMETVDSLSQRFVSPMGKGLEVAARILAKAS